MGSILIVAEIQNGQIREASYELAAFAQKLGGASGRDVHSLVCGKGVDAQADEASEVIVLPVNKPEGEVGNVIARIRPDRGRVNWDHLSANYATWREKGWWITGGPWFGFDVTHAWMVGTERVLMALVTDPEWVVDIFHTMLDLDIALFDMVWDAGYTFDDADHMYVTTTVPVYGEEKKISFFFVRDD